MITFNGVERMIIQNNFVALDNIHRIYNRYHIIKINKYMAFEFDGLITQYVTIKQKTIDKAL